MKKRLAVILLLAGLIVCLAGCGEERYRVDYCGQKEGYQNARDEYRAGERVKLYYGPIAVDADYTFYLDDESISHAVDERGLLVVEFIMPEHDVTLECEWWNPTDFEP